MKLGILTFHSQLNYGGVLQCWALRTALEGMGHEVVVVDRWMSPDNRVLDGPFGHAGLRGWCVIALKSLLGCSTWKQVLRHWRTRRFVKSFNLTPFHFYNWSDLASQPQPFFNLNLDMLVVGSDQVWHGGNWGDPGPYLLDGAPQIKAIAYAASFGMKSLPEGIDYRNGFKRFAAISVREAEGVGLVESQGAQATPVVDPTLLLDPSQWARMGIGRKTPRRVVCYFLSQDVAEAVKVLEPWARQKDCTVEIVCNGMLKAVPRTAHECVTRLKDMVHSVMAPRVRICTSYGPREFVRAFARAEMCITDSFHAVMFSSIFSCNARFLRPTCETRKGMFARIEEFAKECISGDFFVNDVSEALSAFERGEMVSFKADRIAAMRVESVKWLEDAIISA